MNKFQLRFRLLSLSIAFCLLLSFTISVSALEPATYMRSGISFDILSNSIISTNIGGHKTPCDGYASLPAGSTSAILWFDCSGCPPVSQYFFSFEFLGSDDFIVSLNGTTCTRIAVNGYRYSYSCSLSSSTLGYSLRFDFRTPDTVDRSIRLFDFTAIGDTNIVFDSPTSIRVSASTGYKNSLPQQSSPLYSHVHSQLVVGTELMGGLYTETITYTIPKPQTPHDFISFRFYLPSTTVVYDSFHNSFDVVPGSPLISFSLNSSSNSSGIYTAPFPGAVSYTSASSASYFAGSSCICYDVTVDVRTANISNSFYSLTLELLPYNYFPSTRTVVFAAQINGGGCGLYSMEPNELNTFVTWYYQYSEQKYNGFVRDFEFYMNKILDVLGSQPGSDVTDQQAALEDNISAMDSFESEGLASIDSGMVELSGSFLAGFTSLGNALLFIQHYTNLIGDGLNSKGLLIIFVVPVFLGIFFFVVGAAPGLARSARHYDSSRSKSSKKSSKGGSS